MKPRLRLCMSSHLSPPPLDNSLKGGDGGPSTAPSSFFDLYRSIISLSLPILPDPGAKLPLVLEYFSLCRGPPARALYPAGSSNSLRHHVTAWPDSVGTRRPITNRPTPIRDGTKRCPPNQAFFPGLYLFWFRRFTVPTSG